MTGYSERIKPTDFSIRSYLEDLTHQRYQIPTFQRDVVWTPDSVKKLWDSIYRFYPIGSILIWKTDLKLHNHRSIGGHLITDDSKLSDFNYILDGQQRTTSLLTSLYGGHIEGREGFDPCFISTCPLRTLKILMRTVINNASSSGMRLTTAVDK